MNRLFSITVVLLGGWWLLTASVAGQQPPQRDDSAIAGAAWPMDRVELTDGRAYDGLIESEDDAWIHLIQIRRFSDRPMRLVIRPVERAKVARVIRLQPQQRQKLRQRVDRFVNRARIQAARLSAIRLGIVTKEDNHYQHYRGKWFTLDSTVDELTTRRIIVRIEQIFTAYRQILPPQTESRRPLRLVVFGSIDQYETFLKRLDIKIRNKACFIPDDNLVVASSALSRFAALLSAVNARHEQLRAELEALKKQLPQRLAEVSQELRQQGISSNEIARLLRINKVRFQQEVQQKQKELDRNDRENAQKLHGVTRQMFVRLYHEAFHAYLENYVYPHQSHDVPLWLNEGLAMVCEGGLLESDTLRIDSPNAELFSSLRIDIPNATLLKRLQEALAGDRSLPLQELLSTKQQTLVLGPDGDRFYVHSWGLAYYLTFEQRLLSSPALGRYVQPSSEDISPVERFENLVGMPIAEFEKTWREYILKLRQ